jgi:4'-phosphopantetheinyl transferase EntD
VIAEILPAAAVAVEAFDDSASVALFPAEKSAIERAVEKRRREFTTARGCAHRALVGLGLAPGPVPGGVRGEPLWPAGVVGSITHCRGYRGAAVAHAADLVTIGIDAETHASLPDGLVDDVARPGEREMLGELAAATPAIHWDRLLFSAKEAVYKAWFPLTRSWLGFEDAELEIDPRRRAFTARLLVPGPDVGGKELRGFEGAWLVRDGLILTAIALAA